ncbi:hypothetical protein AKJ16_DCAP07236 [Drosera capensis]
MTTPLLPRMTLISHIPYSISTKSIVADNIGSMVNGPKAGGLMAGQEMKRLGQGQGCVGQWGRQSLRPRNDVHLSGFSSKHFFDF